MKKAFSIFLSLLLLISSSGMGYAQHFCEGIEMESKLTFNAHSLSCATELEAAEECHDTSTTLDEDSCCQNLITKVYTDDSYAKATFQFNFEFSYFIFTPISAYFLVAPFVNVQNSVYADYNPPPNVEDLNILYDRFLI